MKQERAGNLTAATPKTYVIYSSHFHINTSQHSIIVNIYRSYYVSHIYLCIEGDSIYAYHHADME